MWITLGLLTIILVAWVVYTIRITTMNLSIIDKKLWIGGAKKSSNIDKAVLNDKMCILEHSNKRVRSPYGATIEKDMTIPCTQCRKYSYKFKDNLCYRMVPRMNLTEFASGMDTVGTCIVDDTRGDKPIECPFKTS